MNRHPRCVSCSIRFAKRKDGLCRSCSRTLGLDTRTTFERERDHAAEMRARRPTVRKRELADPRQPLYTITVDRQDYFVMWNGSLR